MLSGSAHIIPILYKMGHKDLLQISPPLADIFYLKAEDGIAKIAHQIYELIYPGKTVLVEVRDILDQFGLSSPDYYDNWWLDRIEFNGKSDVGFIPWALPLNPFKDEIASRSDTLAWACMRYTWITKAQKQMLNQFSPTEDVLSFITTTPGVESVCAFNLEYITLYAPQLLFIDSPLKLDFHRAYEKSKEILRNTTCSIQFKCELTTNQKLPTCNRLFALLDSEFGGYTSSELLRHFIEGERFGPRPSCLDYWDVLIYLCSEKGNIYPAHVKDKLLEGFYSQYSALQLKKVFIKKSPEFLTMCFSNIEAIKQAVDEIIEDRKITISTSSDKIASMICSYHFPEDYFNEKKFRLTIPREELDLHFRGITEPYYSHL